MQPGIEFLKTEVEDAIAKHGALLQSLTDHGAEAEDARYRDLCERHLPRMREHHRMLEAFHLSLSSATSVSTPQELANSIKRVSGSVVAIARSLADTRQSDYQHLLGDLALVRDLEVTFKTFRDAGRELRIVRLARLGEIAERHHDDYSAEAKRLVLQMFVERAQGAADIVRTVTESRADFRMS